MTVNLSAAQKTAIKAARAAGKVMRDNWYAPKKVNVSEAHDIKLELDVRCQALIEKILAADFPDVPVLGEEGCTGDISAAYRWVVDPIDGTVNYAAGNPHAAVSIALQGPSAAWPLPAGAPARRGSNLVTRQAPHISLVGVIYDPFMDELWSTVFGKPTRLNGRVVRVSQCARVQDAVVAFGFSKSRQNLEKCLPDFLRLTRQARKIRILGSAALELSYIASGRLDAYIERTINLWDVAAGALLLENAGGEFHAVPAPEGKMRMCADNGKLRRKLRVNDLLN
jgi:myo-inositol-1(or 4)-monophosphatase